MTRKPLVLRVSAYEDISSAAEYYVAVGGEGVALRFAEALQGTYRQIANHPQGGSPRLGHYLDIDDLRTRKLARFPYLVLYLERPDQIDVWRVLHAQRDIPAHIGEGER